MSEPGKITIDGVAVEPIRLAKDVTGRRNAEFFDLDVEPCIIEESRPGQPAIWLGCEDAQMRLSRAHVAALLPHLQRFVERGDLGGDDSGAMTATNPSVIDNETA